MDIYTDIVIVGSGVAGLFTAISLPKDKKITIVTKKRAEDSDSYLAQGGICVLRDAEDFESYVEDTMRAGHFENTKEAVEFMIRSSRSVIDRLIDLGVSFDRDENGNLRYTREGAHSAPRILFHEDATGKEITEKLLLRARSQSNISILEHVEMADILCKDNVCYGILAKDQVSEFHILATETLLACGGIGGLYHDSTNFPHLTGDGVTVAYQHGVEMRDLDYVQIHPTTLYSEKPGRRFLISESVRGEGAILLNKNGERFVDELLPRDVVSKAIVRQMKKDQKPYVWLSMENIPKETIFTHFPNIYEHCLSEGYDCTKEYIPVVPAQHYFMGGIKVDLDSKTSMDRLYAAGETSCNGVHGKNRLASNSLLESLVFAEAAAKKMAEVFEEDKRNTRIPTEFEQAGDIDDVIERMKSKDE